MSPTTVILPPHHARQGLWMVLRVVMAMPGCVHCEEPQLDTPLVRASASAASLHSCWRCWPTRAHELEQSIASLTLRHSLPLA
jgi:hypothetical protein